MLFSTYFQTCNLFDPVVTFGEPQKHVITVRGRILVSRIDDDPVRPVCGFKTSPCVRTGTTRTCFNMCAWCRHTRGRCECTHGGVFEAKYRFFNVFSACRSTHKHTRTHTKQHHDHNDTHHTTQQPQNTTHNITRRQRERETENERQDKKTRKEKKREKREGERQEKR